MVMFLFVIAYLGDQTDEAPWAGGPSWQAVGTVLAAGAILAEVIVAIALTTGGLAHARGAHRALVRLARVDRPALPDRPPDRVRGHLDRAARRRGRRGRARLARASQLEERCTGLTSAGTSCSRRCSSSTGALGVLVRRSPLIILLSVEIMLNGANLALIAFARHFGPRGRAGVRDRGDGDRRVRGGRRARPDRRDGPPQRRARRRQAADAAGSDERRRLDLPAAAARRRRSRSPLAGDADLAPRRRLPLDRDDDGVVRGRRRRASSTMLGKSPDERAHTTTSWTWLSAGRYHFGLTLLTDQLSRDDDADRRRRRLADRRLLGRLHGRRGRGAPLLRLHVAVRLLDAAARAGRATCCCCSPAGAWSGSRATC